MTYLEATISQHNSYTNSLYLCIKQRFRRTLEAINGHTGDYSKKEISENMTLRQPLFLAWCRLQQPGDLAKPRRQT